MPPLGLRGRGEAMGRDVVEVDAAVATAESIANFGANGRWLFRWVKSGCNETRRVPVDSCGGWVE